MIIDLKLFCQPNRERLAVPFSIGEWTYATDGKICVRVPRRVDVPEIAFCPAADKLSWQEGNFDVRQLPPIPPAEWSECPVCDGSGHAHTCPDCSCDCDECEGKGEIIHQESIAYGGAYFTVEYWQKMITLPNLRLPETAKPDGVMPFRFDGGEGLILARRVP